MLLKKIVLLLLFGLFPMTCVNFQLEAQTHKQIPIEEIHKEVKDLLLLIPKGERKLFVDRAKRFGKKRGIDWRFLLMLFYQESGLNPKTISGNYAGIAMFGPQARNLLGITKSELVSKTHYEQFELAIEMWNYFETKLGLVNEFVDLIIINFAPAWLNHPGNPYPASDLIKKSNPAFVNKKGNITKESILSFYRRKSKREPSLKYFINKF